MTLTRPTTRWLLFALAILATGLALGFGVATINVPLIVVGAACLCVAARIPWMGVFTRDDVLIVRNYFSTRRIRRSEIEDFFPAPIALSTFRNSVRVRLVSGRSVGISLYSSSPFDRIGWSDSTVSNLRRWLDATDS